MRIGVGSSLAFLRKQRGIRELLSRSSPGDRLFDALAPNLDDPDLTVTGFHYYTFNQLVGTWILVEPRPGPLTDALVSAVENLGERGFRSVIAHPERHPGTDFREQLEALTARGALIRWLPSAN